MNQAQQFIRLLQIDGLTITMIAARVGVARATISRIASGKQQAGRKLVLKLQKLCLALGKSTPIIQQEPGSRPYIHKPDKPPRVVRDEPLEPDIPPLVEERIAEYGTYSLTRTVPSTQANKSKQHASSRRRQKSQGDTPRVTTRKRQRNKKDTPLTALSSPGPTSLPGTLRAIITSKSEKQLQAITPYEQAIAYAKSMAVKQTEERQRILSLALTLSTQSQLPQLHQISAIEQHCTQTYRNNTYRPDKPLYEYQEPEVTLAWPRNSRYIDHS